MTRLPLVNFKTMEKVFANHPGRDLSRPLIREILREIELTPEQFQEALEKR